MIQEKTYTNLVGKELLAILENVTKVAVSVNEIERLTANSKKEIQENDDIKEMLFELSYASKEIVSYCAGFKEELEMPLYNRK